MIYNDQINNNKWCGKKSLSGTGSDLSQTRIIAAEIPLLLKELKIIGIFMGPQTFHLNRWIFFKILCPRQISYFAATAWCTFHIKISIKLYIILRLVDQPILSQQHSSSMKTIEI